mmetsp:Transcript_1360/g.3656  ORF Transcript_1360/g.3656 Transcript_1360/m.3656 type:complete len:92 (-) Transcript_1360:236-511(-)
MSLDGVGCNTGRFIPEGLVLPVRRLLAALDGSPSPPEARGKPLVRGGRYAEATTNAGSDWEHLDNQAAPPLPILASADSSPSRKVKDDGAD